MGKATAEAGEAPTFFSATAKATKAKA